MKPLKVKKKIYFFDHKENNEVKLTNIPVMELNSSSIESNSKIK